MRHLPRLVYLFLIIILLLPLTDGVAARRHQEATPDEKARQLLDTLTPEERVGQLFLVTFIGPEAGPSTQIYNLVVNYHIGGVILLRQNDNFIAADQTLPIALILTRQLQLDEYSASLQEQKQPNSEEKFTPAFIPLLIGISQEGDGYPYDQIIDGMTKLPSQMTLGATWNLDMAKQAGIILGTELSSLGFNMLLGPSLDVLEKPHPTGSGDLGVRTFGGDPFWVGEMGRAFIAGVHQGAKDEIAVVAKHFPGFGSSDRLPEEEVATVRKTLDQLKQVDLAPFFAVTGDAPSPTNTVDALLTAHIRYQGFTENPRATTKPVSFDPQAFSKLMSLPQIDTWRQKGGVMISDDLGGQAVRRFYETSGQSFVGRYVARDAFLAGNDLLYLGNFAEADVDSYQGIVRTLEFFTQKYREDTAFAERVDISVQRILALKYRIYKNSFTLTQARGPANLPGAVGKSSALAFEITKQASTLISPTSQEELNNLIPDPPGRNDRIVILTDTRIAQQCSNCPMENVLPVNAMEQVVIRLYSPQAGGQVLPANLKSYSFENLQEMLDKGPGIVEIEKDLRNAKWIVVVMQNPDPDIPSSLAFTGFLTQRPDLYKEKHLIVFALNAPYYLDATNISKITAYYALYNKTLKAIDVAARLLFHEFPNAQGALPVSVTGVGYDLFDATSPAPNQLIPLMIDVPQAPVVTTETTTPEATQIPTFKIGDTISIRTGIILDHNGHVVPDKTPVRFIITHGDGSLPQTDEVETTNGIARTIIKLEIAGVTQIRAESDPAKTSDVLQFEIPVEPVVTVTLPSPTVTPSLTSTSTPTATSTPSATPTPTVIPPRSHTNVNEWLLALLITGGTGIIAFWLARLAGQARWGIREGLLALMGGMLAYIYLAAGMPGSTIVIQNSGTWGILGISMLGAGIGWGAALGWRGLKKGK